MVRPGMIARPVLVTEEAGPSSAEATPVGLPVATSKVSTMPASVATAFALALMGFEKIA